MSNVVDEFSNRAIDPDQMPDFQRVHLEPMTANYLPHVLISRVGVWLLLALLALIASYLPFGGFKPGLLTVLVLLVAGLWFGLIAVVDVRRRGWAVREHDLIYRYGVIWRKTVIVPFARIQHVETTSGPLERMLGLMRVKCFTAGGASSDLTIEGLDADAARQVCTWLLEQIRNDSGSATDEIDQGRPSADD